MKKSLRLVALCAFVPLLAACAPSVEPQQPAADPNAIASGAPVDPNAAAPMAPAAPVAPVVEVEPSADSRLWPSTNQVLSTFAQDPTYSWRANVMTNQTSLAADLSYAAPNVGAVGFDRVISTCILLKENPGSPKLNEAVAKVFSSANANIDASSGRELLEISHRWACPDLQI